MIWSDHMSAVTETDDWVWSFFLIVYLTPLTNKGTHFAVIVFLPMGVYLLPITFKKHLNLHHKVAQFLPILVLQIILCRMHLLLSFELSHPGNISAISFTISYSTLQSDMCSKGCFPKIFK